MNWAFVDYENVRTLEAINLAVYQRVFVFCGPQNKSIKFDELPASGICQVDLITVPTSSKNNVDFHLAFHLGVEHQRAAPEVNFHVISNDKGYQGLINHLELLGRPCKLVEPNATKKIASKKVTSKRTTGRAKTPARTNASAAVIKPESTAATKPVAKAAATTKSAQAATNKSTATKAVANKPGTSKSGLGKTTTSKTAPGKSSSSNALAKSVSRAGVPPLSESATKLFGQLQATSANRPKTKARVLSWLKSHVKSLHASPEPEPEAILTEWKNTGLLILTGNTVSYPEK